MPLGFIDALNPLDTVVSHFFSLSSGIVEQNSIPCVWEIVLSNVFVQGGIVPVLISSIFLYLGSQIPPSQEGIMMP